MTTKPFVPSDRDTAYVTEPLPPPRPWFADRPGETAEDPEAPTFGSVGPDLGYAKTLLPLFRDRIVPGALHREDVLTAGAAVAMRRAAMSGRAPIPEDLEVAFLLIGALDGVPGDWSQTGGVVGGLIEGCRYAPGRAAHIAAAMPEDWLRRKPGGVRQRLLEEGPVSIFEDADH